MSHITSDATLTYYTHNSQSTRAQFVDVGCSMLCVFTKLHFRDNEIYTQAFYSVLEQILYYYWYVVCNVRMWPWSLLATEEMEGLKPHATNEGNNSAKNPSTSPIRNRDQCLHKKKWYRCYSKLRYVARPQTRHPGFGILCVCVCVELYSSRQHHLQRATFARFRECKKCTAPKWDSLSLHHHTIWLTPSGYFLVDSRWPFVCFCARVTMRRIWAANSHVAKRTMCCCCVLYEHQLADCRFYIKNGSLSPCGVCTTPHQWAIYGCGQKFSNASCANNSYNSSFKYVNVCELCVCRCVKTQSIRWML